MNKRISILILGVLLALVGFVTASIFFDEQKGGFNNMEKTVPTSETAALEDFVPLYGLEEYSTLKKCAVCYWGLTRSTRNVFDSHIKHIHKPLRDAGIPFDVFLHTWEIEGKQFVWKDAIDIPVNYDEYKLLRPTFFQRDAQKDFIESIDFSDYFYQKVFDEKGHSQHGEWEPMLVRNHICALESQKRSFAMVDQNEYAYVLFVRPDVRFNKDIPIKEIVSFLDSSERGIGVPNVGHYEGVNDRFAAMNTRSAHMYANRIDDIKEYRKNHGRIVAEKYVGHVCRVHKLDVRQFHINFNIVRPAESNRP